VFLSASIRVSAAIPKPVSRADSFSIALRSCGLGQVRRGASGLFWDIG
jgi:hypothetical protein